MLNAEQISAIAQTTKAMILNKIPGGLMLLDHPPRQTVGCRRLAVSARNGDGILERRQR